LTSEKPNSLTASKKGLEFRSETLHCIRNYFHDRDFLEVETPIRVPTPALELHIDAEPSGAGFLRTSPELHMKRLLSAGYKNIFQIGPCFRKGEKGHLHHPEYTMLEWYECPGNYMSILEQTKSFLLHLCRQIHSSTSLHYQGHNIEFDSDWPEYSVCQLFHTHAGWDPSTEFDQDHFDEDLVTIIEPLLPKDQPVILKDFPAALAAMSALHPNNKKIAQRWELYLGGIEIANAYSELWDAEEQRQRMEHWSAQRLTQGRESYAVDNDFINCLNGELEAGGIALGIDRLVMIFMNATSLDELIAFREDV